MAEQLFEDIGARALIGVTLTVGVSVGIGLDPIRIERSPDIVDECHLAGDDRSVVLGLDNYLVNGREAAHPVLVAFGIAAAADWECSFGVVAVSWEQRQRVSWRGGVAGEDCGLLGLDDCCGVVVDGQAAAAAVGFEVGPDEHPFVVVADGQAVEWQAAYLIGAAACVHEQFGDSSHVRVRLRRKVVQPAGQGSHDHCRKVAGGRVVAWGLGDVVAEQYEIGAQSMQRLTGVGEPEVAAVTEESAQVAHKVRSVVVADGAGAFESAQPVEVVEQVAAVEHRLVMPSVGAVGQSLAEVSARGIVKLFENGWGAVVVGDSEAVMCWLAVGFHAAAAAVISSQTSKRSAISLRHWGALTR